MATINGTVTGISFLSGQDSGNGALKSYKVTVDFPAYTGSTDTMTVTGIITAINAATRNGKTLTLRACQTIAPGADTAAQLVYPTGASVWAATLANTTTTGDISGNLSVLAGTEITSTTAVTGCVLAAVVSEA